MTNHKRMISLTGVGLMIVGTLFACESHAFKINTHVWLADQIATEIENSNGSVKIKGRTYALDGRVAAAIRKDPGAFVMGTLGADIYPDMFAGQMTTHPGVNPEGKAPGWQTDDWLRHVIDTAMRSNNQSNIAFAAGYVLHAAMDMWAHSYVNLYSGDVFEIVNNSETAQRHAALENYLTRFHANLRDQHPKRSSRDKYDDMRAPAKFVRETLIFHPMAAREYARDPSTATFYYDAMYRYYLAARRSRAGTLTLAQLLQTELDRIDPLLDELPRLKTQIDAKQEAFDAHLLRLADVAQNILNGIGDLVDSTGIEAALAANNIDIDLDGAARQAADALDLALAAYKQVTDQIGYNVSGFYDPDTIRATLRRGIQLAGSGTIVQKWPQDIEAAMDAWVRAWEDTARHLMRPHGARGRNPLRPMQAWTKCWGPVMFPINLPPALQNLPATCDGTLAKIDRVTTEVDAAIDDLVGLVPGTHALRAAIDGVRNDVEQAIGVYATDALDAIGQAVSQNAPSFDSGPLPSDPTGLATWMVRMWDSNTTMADLDQAYENSSSRRNYVARRVTPALHRELGVCDAPHLKASTYTQAPFAGFAPVQNAVTMSKLALLPAKELNALVTHHVAQGRPARDRAAPTKQQLYTSKRPMGAVLIGALRSIDGDHQWQPIAPALPRSDPATVDEKQWCRRYGYPLGDAYEGGSCSAGNISSRDLRAKRGFLLYREDLRSPVFNALFQPIAPHLCDFVQYPHPGTQCAEGESFPAYAPDQPLRRKTLPTRAARTSINKTSDRTQTNAVTGRAKVSAMQRQSNAQRTAVARKPNPQQALPRRQVPVTRPQPPSRPNSTMCAW